MIWGVCLQQLGATSEFLSSGESLGQTCSTISSLPSMFAPRACSPAVIGHIHGCPDERAGRRPPTGYAQHR